MCGKNICRNSSKKTHGYYFLLLIQRYIVSTKNCGHYFEEIREWIHNFELWIVHIFVRHWAIIKICYLVWTFLFVKTSQTLIACLMIFNVCFFTLWVLFLFQIIIPIWTSKRSMAYMENLIECLSKPCWPGALLLPVN